MKTIDTDGTVSADGQLTVRVPPDIVPGVHKVRLVIDEQPYEPIMGMDSLGLSTFTVPWPADLSLRREDLYDERGR